MKKNIPSTEQLKRAIAITEQIEKLEAELAAILAGSGFKISASRRGRPAKADRPKRQMSDEARQKIAAAQKKRWAKAKKAKKAEDAAAQ